MVEHFGHESGRSGFWPGGRVARFVGLAVAGAAAVVLFAAVFGWLVQILWNWLMPPIFGLKTVTFWQGFGILLLAKLLFGAVGPGHRRRRERWGRRFRERVPGVDSDAESGPDDEPMPGDGRRWPMFRGFWREEGRAAFEAYVQKKRSEGEK